MGGWVMLLAALARAERIHALVGIAAAPDFTEDLQKIEVPTLVMHGEHDQIVPFADSGPLSAKLLKNATTKFYPGFPHGMPTTHADQINADLLGFIKGEQAAVA